MRFFLEAFSVMGPTKKQFEIWLETEYTNVWRELLTLIYSTDIDTVREFIKLNREFDYTDIDMFEMYEDKDKELYEYSLKLREIDIFIDNREHCLIGDITNTYLLSLSMEQLKELCLTEIAKELYAKHIIVYAIANFMSECNGDMTKEQGDIIFKKYDTVHNYLIEGISPEEMKEIQRTKQLTDVDTINNSIAALFFYFRHKFRIIKRSYQSEYNLKSFLQSISDTPMPEYEKPENIPSYEFLPSEYATEWLHKFHTGGWMKIEAERKKREEDELEEN